MKVEANTNLILKKKIFRHNAVLLVWKKPQSVKLVRKGQQEEAESSNCYSAVTETEQLWSNLCLTEHWLRN